MIEGLKLKGRFTGTLVKENGDVEVFCKDNLVVNAGVDFVFWGIIRTGLGYQCRCAGCACACRC